MRILRCNCCSYSRSSEEDGRMMDEDEVLGGLICQECRMMSDAFHDLVTKGKTALSSGNITVEVDYNQ